MSFAQEMKDFFSAYSAVSGAKERQMKLKLYQERINALKNGKFNQEEAEKDWPGATAPTAIPESKDDNSFLKNNDAGGGKDSSGATVNFASLNSMGDPSDPKWQEANLTTISSPNGEKWTVNKAAAKDFSGFLTELHDEGYLPKSSGGFNVRRIAGSNKPSQHAWANAIDIDAAHNARGTKGNLPDNVAEIAAKYNLTWGGNWKNPDPMHFEWRGPQKAVPAPSYLADQRAELMDDEEGAIPEDPTMYSRRGGMVARYEEGGLVDDSELDTTAMNEDLGYNDQPAEDDVETTGAIPERPVAERPMPQQKADPGTGNILVDAISGGLKFLQKTFGLDQSGAAVGNDPDLRRRQEAFMRGEGAATGEDMQLINQTVDPDGRMNDTLRHIYGLTKGYEFYILRGDVQKANKYAAAVIQSSALAASKYGAIAVEAGRNGDIDGMIKAGKMAYSHTLDGKDADAKRTPDGNIEITQKDAESGEVTNKFKVTPQQFFNAAMGLTNKSGYYQHLMQVAANTPSVASQRLAGQQKQQGTVEELTNEFMSGESEGDAGTPAAQTTAAPSKDTAAPAPAPAGTPTPAPAEGAAIPETPAPVATAQVPTTPAPTVAQNGPGASAIPPTGATPEPEITGSTVQPQVTAEGNPEAVPSEPRLSRPIVGEYPVARPQLSPKQKQALQKLAAIKPAVANALYNQWKQNVLMPWEQDRKNWFDQQNKQATVDFEQSRMDVRQKATDKAAQDRQNRADKAAAQREAFIGERDAKLEQMRQDHAVQMEQLKAAKPIDFDVKDKDAIAEVQSTLEQTILNASADENGTPRMTADQIKKQYTADQLQGLRDATIAIHRYNRLPLDTAAQAALSMTLPGQTGDEAFKYRVSPIKGVPADPVDGPRVMVTFRNPSSVLTGVILPKSVVDRLDVIRGKQMKKAFNSMVEQGALDIENTQLKDVQKRSAEKTLKNMKKWDNPTPNPFMMPAPSEDYESLGQ